MNGIHSYSLLVNPSRHLPMLEASAVGPCQVQPECNEPQSNPRGHSLAAAPRGNCIVSATKNYLSRRTLGARPDVSCPASSSATLQGRPHWVRIRPPRRGREATKHSRMAVTQATTPGIRFGPCSMPQVIAPDGLGYKSSLEQLSRSNRERQPRLAPKTHWSWPSVSMR